MAYSSPAAPTRTARDAEYEAIAAVTRALSKANANGRSDFKNLVSALHKNRQLWTIFAASVADPENKLPTPLRAQIFYLYEFTNHHTSEVLAGRADAGPLIDVNASIMHGLRSGRPAA